ncbi:MAG TPA: type II toxin-antitoxin system death-on-curing family toxin [Tepidisphaeraceae bacterium]|jgi:death-on-curing protein|nr:type II toxin-antitoxin system death-on-curing family toxin [Tepidisphaeraceae bacterium]
MGDINFLTLDEVLELHVAQIELFGGSAGLRDLGLLESALAQPMQAFGGQYLHEDLAAMAAAYLYHIVSNHPFLDGNKRTGTDAAIVFLEINGVELPVENELLIELVLEVAKGNKSKEAVAEYFRRLIP